MCGFTGFIDFNETKYDYQEILTKCHKLISFRGPDDNKILLDVENKIYISFERLSFFDLSKTAMQPLYSKNKRFLFLMNGEVYNFSNLNSLLNKNEIFVNHKSDTVVALEYISNFGLNNFLDVAIGMFSIVLIDIIKKEIYFVSDSFSQKPLYYSVQNNTLFFSSDLRTIHAHENFVKEINFLSLNEYFLKSYISSPNTIYNKIFKLASSNLVKLNFNNGLINIVESSFYNNFTPSIENVESSFEISSIRQIIENSVELHLKSDVPIGTFLSSGIDSSLITAIASKIDKNIESFSMGFDSKEFDESSDSKKIADHLNIKHHTIPFNTESLVNDVLDTANIYSEPFADSSQIPFGQLCRSASSHVKGILSGDGGDEIFGGYHRHLLGSKIYNLSRQNIYKILFSFLLSVADTNLFKKIIEFITPLYLGDKISRLKRSIASKNLDDFYLSITSDFNFNDIINGINYEIQNDYIKNDIETNKFIMWKDLTSYLPNDLMVKSDRASMFNSLEVRAPLLFRELASLMKNIETKYILKNNQKKYILKSILGHYLPQQLIQKNKKGFIAPIKEWLNKDLLQLRETYFSKKNLSHNFFNENIIKNNLIGFEKGMENQRAIWNLLIFQIWHDKYH